MDGVTALLGLNRFEMSLTIEVGAVSINGESKHMVLSTRACSIACASRRLKEARSAKKREARAPNGAQPPLGPVLSGMTPIIEVVAVVTPGRSSHALLPNRSVSMFVVCASGKLRAALSVRESVKAAAGGVHLRLKILSGPYVSVMTPTTAVEAVNINGTWIAPLTVAPFCAHHTVHAPEGTLHSTLISLKTSASSKSSVFCSVYSGIVIVSN